MAFWLGTALALYLGRVPSDALSTGLCSCGAVLAACGLGVLAWAVRRTLRAAGGPSDDCGAMADARARRLLAPLPRPIGAGDVHAVPKRVFGEGRAHAARPAAGMLAALFLLGLSAGLAWGAGCACERHAAAESFSCSDRVCVELTADSRPAGEGWRASATICAGKFAGARVGVLLPPRVEPYRYGERLSGDASFLRADYATDERAWSEGVVGAVRLRTASEQPVDGIRGAVLEVRRRAVEALDAPGTDASAVLSAVVCGYRSTFADAKAAEDFRRCGMAHLVAVSGAHLAVVAALALSLLRAARAPRVLQVGLVALLLGCYLVFSAVPVSAIRAGVMCLLGLASIFSRRRAAGLSALGLCVLAMVGLDPSAALSVSFALSALATLGIALYASRVAEAVCSRVPIAPRAVAETLGATVAASALTLPLSACLFGRLPLVAIVANALAAPLFAPLCAAGLLGALAAVAVPGVAGPIVLPGGLLSQALCLLAGALADLPFASVPVSLGPLEAVALTALCLVSAFLSGRMASYRPCASRSTRRGLAGLVALCCALGFLWGCWPAADLGTRMVMLDVGQGDAFLLQSEGASLLVDTGRYDNRLLQGLSHHGVTHLDAVLITHADEDHCGSLGALKGAVSVDRVLMARGVDQVSEPKVRRLVQTAHQVARDVGYLEVEDVVELGALRARVVWPEEVRDGYGNADSVCLDVRADLDRDGNSECRALFTGDAEAPQLRGFARREGLEDIDVLKVCHHGSRHGLDEGLARLLRPHIALISVGKGNRYGHPSPEVLALLEDVGARVLRTDVQGEVSCEVTVEGIAVSAER
ncbi:DNA internalization-related competence protein ComEC/Rec2 [Eggerthellaceae bacterium zg-1084]|uniref:DNA internalization-related competence protein ComEC/Rec2 n=1 Tax=Berryella wangjianweii TaxID=2734634 RepID=UPI00155314F6|nr:DNA internalization-related competence protein ComEC/Rec2 [Berryella wangjianweii]NPD30321.1 DNA internalization-related competence protein ComEC/Rec2 [Berryella wangjianweii]